MTRSALTTPFSWHQYSKQLAKKIERPRNAGFFTPEDASSREMFFATASRGETEDGNALSLYWLVDKDDGIIVDAKFQALGQSALIGAAEASCELLIGKNYDQAQRMGKNLIDKHLRDKHDLPAFPHETSTHLDLVLETIYETAKQCTSIPLSKTYTAPPTPTNPSDTLPEGIPEWNLFETKQKMEIIEEVIDREIRPYIEMDGGGVTLLDLVNDREVLISYSGACTSCYSSIGATLTSIQQLLQAQVHPNLVVIPDLENLNL